ncbi:hypothetical protein ZYGR_0I04210 [Zygosaccharomyces rouxii]|uniref:ZYRO0C10076p n=2 Tax=Zygosaccharomyces rouxii TaxID=4956 RepID=C5DTN8_ZYGRC|nr:uncharacterized protein ZYRO0C10076g [Zygosaccharomyces rouxii]KAH9201673.1 hypothetical protein LQ764DRAFT_83337 [Zygosaccharomyces rouxii]GAV48124.1 hypothetical protein ZYGR_0I04210 [Zygosaccharomyces rouxii]CAR27149.1 ZYRO0C10076p [Zygosaccharomyces rouxii]
MAKKKVISVTQEDWYIEATEYEEQAERWILSDIKKTLRFYLQALECYERALQAPEGSSTGSYNILYNETRLFLQVYTEYVANNGYINVLQYIKLDDLPGISNLILSLPEIVQRFQAVQQRFQQETTWDFHFNMLTCYLSLLESADTYNLVGEDVIQLTTKYLELTQSLVQTVMQKLQFTSDQPNNDQLPGSAPREEVPPNKRDGSGVVTQTNDDDDADGSQRVEVADQVNYETIAEILSNGFKCVQTLVEICVDSRQGESRLNPVQVNFLEDVSSKFWHQLTDIRSSVDSLGLDLSQADISGMVIDALKLINDGVPALEQYILSVSPRTSEVLLAQVDLLQFVVGCLDPTADATLQWSLCTLLNKVLEEARRQFTHLRSKVSLNPTGDELSRITFHLCDIYIDSSDNELTRYWIRRSSNNNGNNNNGDADDKTCQILLKNAKTMLINATRIAERPCGLQENVVDKLKRNYVFTQARNRLRALESGNIPVDQIQDQDQDIQNHPFYRNLILSTGN